MKFNDVLKKLRIDKKMSQEDLAKDTGLTRSAIGMYEGGNREPNFDTLELLADYFNVDIDYLLGKETRSTYYLNPETAKLAQEAFDDPDVRILLDAKRNLSPEDLQFVINLVKKLKKDDNHDQDDTL
jgi:transcriptional regulator with XRE-family HTH domain